MPAPSQHLGHTLARMTQKEFLSELEELGSEAAADLEIAGAEGAENHTAYLPSAPRTANELRPGDSEPWTVTLSMRSFKSGDVFVGSEEIHAVKEAGTNAIGTYETMDLGVSYAFDQRWNLTVTLPLVDLTDSFPHADGNRHSSTTGLTIGDLRAVASYWLFDPAKPRRGNIVLGFGIKAPTGDYDLTNDFYTPVGVEVLPMDLATQPGDGGWGVILAGQAFRTLGRRTYAYGDLYYLLSPKETNGVVTPAALFLTQQATAVSVPDQYSVRAGFGHLTWPKHGISLSLGVRLDGIPQYDLIGSSEGFRRPGHTLALDPGVNFTWGANTLSIYAPTAIDRRIEQSVPEKRLSARLGTTIHGGGSLADDSLFVGYSRRFGSLAGNRPPTAYSRNLPSPAPAGVSAPTSLPHSSLLGEPMPMEIQRAGRIWSSFDSDGTRIRYTEGGAGEAVILLHGFTGDSEWNWLAPGTFDRLAKTFRVIAMDMRGHGASAAPGDRDSEDPTPAADVLRLMDHLGLPEAYLVGYSAGGQIVMSLLTSHPDRVSGAVVGAAGLGDSGLWEGVADLLASLGPDKRITDTLYPGARFDERTAEIINGNDPAVLAQVARGLSDLEIGEEALRANEVPTLLLVGEDDWAREGVERALAVGSSLEMRVLAGRDHMTAVSDPVFARHIQEFLLGHSGSARPKTGQRRD